MAFKRSNGTTVGGARSKVEEHFKTIRVAKLLPLEGAVVCNTIAYFRQKFRRKRSVIAPAKVVEVGNSQFLVIDGNHRVYAAKLEGKAKVIARVIDPGINATFRQDAADRARLRSRLGFNNITVVDSNEAREAFTRQEASDDDWSQA